MITNARLDEVILSDSIAPALNALVPLFQEPWLIGAEYHDTGAAIPTRLRLHYDANDLLGPAAERIVYMPSYEQSGHFVSLTQPSKFFDDVKAFLAATSIGG